MNLWTLKRSRAWIEANDEERALWLAGIEPRYWKFKQQDAECETFVAERTFKTQTITASEQILARDKLLSKANAFQYPTLAVCGSEPTDYHAVGFAVLLLRKAKEQGLSIGMLDLGNIPPHSDSPNFNDDRYARLVSADVIVLHNILAEATIERLQLARNWIKFFKDRFCICVIAGTEPLAFADNKLRVKVDLVFKLAGPSPKVREV